MNFLKRAWLSVIRRKGKSLILFAVIFILGNVIAGAIAIQQSTANVEKKVKADLGAIATVDYDYEALDEVATDTDFVWPDPLSEEQINEIGEMPYVKEYDYSIGSYVPVDSFKTISYNDVTEDDDTTFYGGEETSYVSIKGTNATEPMDFKDKKVVLVDGRTFTAEDAEDGGYRAIISSRIASENSLSVGDQLTLDGQYQKYDQETGATELLKGADYVIEVIGIFEPTTVEVEQDENNPNSDPFMVADQFNSFYMTNEAVKEINRSQYEVGKANEPELYTEDFDEMFYPTPIYVLNSPDDVEAFREEVTPLVPQYFKVILSTDKYDEVGSGMNRLAQISGYVVIIAVIATLIIISLVVILFLRDRKHELGIYLSLGEKRQNVVFQIIVELLVISLVAMCLSLVTGNLLGQAVSDSLMQSEMMQSAGNMGDTYYYNPLDSATSLTVEDIQSAYSVDFSVGYIATFLVAGMLTVFGSAILPLLYILRLNPKKIMM